MSKPQKMTQLLFQNATIVSEGKSSVSDLLVSDGKIERIGKGLSVPVDCEVIDATGKLLTYGLCDVHVHFRVPGRPDKETILTGSQAAAAGGYTTVCTMPNLDPCPDTPAHLAEQQALIDRDAVVDVLPYATLTLGRKGLLPVDMAALKPHVVGFSDDGSGIQDRGVMRQLMEQAVREDVIIAAHCEDNTLLHGGYIHAGSYAEAHGHRGIVSESEWGQIARDLELAKETGCRYHVCHISTKESVALIRKYKAEGVRVTCETAPHYLTLCEDDLREEGRFKMNPPLRSAGDRTALIEGLCDGTIDCIATDHAPHTDEEKGRGLANSPFGIVGLETSFAVLYTHLVCKGIISLERMVELMTDAPRRAFRISGKLAEGEPADLALFDVENEYPIDSQNFKSKGKATPFDGWKVRGRCLMTLKGGYRI
jgi:dihydroorotase